MSELRSRLIRLAAAKPELRADLLPLLKEESDPASFDQNKPGHYYGLPPRGVQAARKPNSPGEKHQLKVLIDTVRNPMKGKFLGGPSAEDAEKTLRDTFGYSDAEIDRIKGKGVQAARRRERVVFMVTTAITGPMVVNVTNGINKKYPYDGTPEGLAATLQEVATGAIRLQSMDFLDGPELNVVKAPRVPPNLAQTVFARIEARVGAVYVALRGTSMGLEWAILPRAPKFAASGRQAGTGRKAHGPVAIRQPEVMLYAIDASASAHGQSKFYEMKVVPFGTRVDVTRPTVQKQKDFRGRGAGGFTLLKRWGRLTDSGSPGRVDAMDEHYDTESDARAAMQETKMGKMRGSGSARYTDVTRTREYPIGLGGSGFGWGGQQACAYVPELRDLRQSVTAMNVTIANTAPAIQGLAQKNSDVGRRVSALLGELQGTLGSLQSYLDDQMRHC